MLVVIDISADGEEVTMDVRGAKGRNCERAAKLFEGAFGRMKEGSNKPEYYGDDGGGGVAVAQPVPQK